MIERKLSLFTGHVCRRERAWFLDESTRSTTLALFPALVINACRRTASRLGHGVCTLHHQCQLPASMYECLQGCLHWAEPHAQTEKYAGTIGNETVKLGRSVAGLHSYRLGHTSELRAIVWSICSGKHTETLGSTCLRRIVTQTGQDKRLVYTELGVECHALVTVHIRVRDIVTAQPRLSQRVKSRRRWPSDDFLSMSAHHSANLLSARGDVRPVVHGTNGSTILERRDEWVSEWVSSFLTARQHIIGHSVP